MNINIIVVALIVVVIFLISQNMPKKEDFAWWDDARDWLKGAGKTVKSGTEQAINDMRGVNSKMIDGLTGWLNQGNIVENQKINCGDATMPKCDINPLYKFSCPNECAKGTNSIAQCREWAYRQSDECRANPNYMLPMCAQACNERDTNNNVIF